MPMYFGYIFLTGMEYTEVTLLVAKCVGTKNIMGWKKGGNFGLTGHLKTKTTTENNKAKPNTKLEVEKRW